MVDEFYAVLGMAYGAEPEIFGFSHPSVLINCRFHEGCTLLLCRWIPLGPYCMIGKNIFGFLLGIGNFVNFKTKTLTSVRLIGSNTTIGTFFNF